MGFLLLLLSIAGWQPTFASGNAGTAKVVRAPAAAPSPRAPHKPRIKDPHPERVQLQSRNALKPVVIIPRAGKATAEPATDFKLVYAGKKLSLVFVPLNPKFILAPQKLLMVQLDSDSPLTVQPTLITESNWPKDATQMSLSIAGGLPGKFTAVNGTAAYSLCQKGTNTCHKAKCQFHLAFQP